MYSKNRMGSSWWVALWIYVVTFFLVTLTFFQAASAEDLKSKNQVQDKSTKSADSDKTKPADKKK